MLYSETYLSPATVFENILTARSREAIEIFVFIGDIQKIMSYGIMRTPGLVINQKVVISGRVPSMKEIKEIIIKNR